MANNPSNYRLSPLALRDVEDIWLYTAENWSAAQADTYIDALSSTFATLAGMPTMAREYREFHPPVRIHPSGAHLVIYRSEAYSIIIIRVLGSAQNWQALLDPMVS